MFPIKHATKEIRVTGLQRSGNHAIINWIRRQAILESAETIHVAR